MKIKIVYLLGLLLIMNVHLKAKASDSELFFYNSIEKIKEIQDLDESIIKRLKEVYDRNLFIGNTKSEIIALNWAMSKEKIDQNIIIKILIWR